MWAAGHGDTEAVIVLFEPEKETSTWTDLVYAAAIGDIGMAREHLHEAGQSDATNRAVLMCAAYSSHADIVRLPAEHKKEMRDELAIPLSC